MPEFESNNSKYDKFLTSDADLPEPSADLQRKVMRRIARYERRILIAKTVGFGGIFAASAALMIAAYFNLMSALAQSGFVGFASLFFSDFGAATANFQDFVFSTLESFPVFSAAFLLVGVILVIWSAIHFAKDISEVRAHRGLAMT
jgi:VIT1/CCC1 family predicted Fe2+/Mn2+ transporter